MEGFAEPGRERWQRLADSVEKRGLSERRVTSLGSIFAARNLHRLIPAQEFYRNVLA